MLKQLPSLEEQLRKQAGKKEQQSKGSGKNGIIESKNGSANKNGGEGEPIMTEELRKVLVALSSNSSSHHSSPATSPNKNLNKSLGSTSPTVPSTSQRKVISPESLFHVIWKVVPR